MILDKEVEITIGTKNKKYYSDLLYSVTGIGQKISVKTEHLQNGCADHVSCKCDVCGKETIIRYNSYIKNTKNLTEPYCCCQKCAQEKRKQNCLEKYGVEFVSQNKEISDKMKSALINSWENKSKIERQSILEKRQETMMANHGYINPLSDENIRERIKQTNLKKYGFVNVFQNEDIKEKSKQTCKKNYGVEHPGQSGEIMEKINKIMINKFGEHPMKNETIRNKFKQTMMKNHGVENPMQDPDMFKRAQKSSFKIFQYKDANLTYQAGYEKHFLEQMEKHGFLNELSMGKSYDYFFEEKLHKYHSDYLFKDVTIELKSTWTYNLNGDNIKKGLMNEAKWQAVRNEGDELIILFSKKEIKNYVENLSQLFIEKQL